VSDIKKSVVSAFPSHQWTGRCDEAYLGAVRGSPSLLTREGHIFIKERTEVEARIDKKIRQRCRGGESDDTDEDELASAGMDEGQSAALGMMKDARRRRAVCILCGAAGTGKSMVVGRFLGLQKQATVVTALTHKALSCAERAYGAQNRSVVEFRTIASLQVSTRDIDIATAFCVVEEASLVGAAQMEFLLSTFVGGVALVGDPYQLEPVLWGDPFRDCIRRARGVGGSLVELQVSHRCKGGVLELAGVIRGGSASAPDPSNPLMLESRIAEVVLGSSNITVLDEHSVQGVVDAFIGVTACAPREISLAQILVTTNKDKKQINDAVYAALRERGALKGPAQPAAGKPGPAGSSGRPARPPMYADGTKVVCKHLGCGMRRREFGVVQGEPWMESCGRHFYNVLTSRDRLVPMPEPSIGLGYAETVHSFQGDQAEHVIFARPCYRSTMATSRLIYTAVTRCSGHLYVRSVASLLPEGDAPRVTWAGPADTIR
jgi:hypothetical protein